MKVFSKLENRFGMIMGRNIKGMSFSGWMTTVPLVSRLSIFDSTRTSRVEPGLFSFSIRESTRNIRDNHPCNALGTKRRISDMEAIIVPRKIRIVLPYVLPLSRVEMPEVSLLRWILRQHWSDRAGKGNKIVVGGA